MKEQANPYIFKLVETKNSDINNDPVGIYTLISHKELDSLIGQLMQMCDLTGDIEQRKALKDTMKRICRRWLDNIYAASGYDKFKGVAKDAYIIKD